ncbi:MAG: hypothetical protein ACHP7N_00725 [Caulobacterales bacterium]
MAEQSRRSLTNMVFIVLIALAILGAADLAWRMYNAALSGPG